MDGIVAQQAQETKIWTIRYVGWRRESLRPNTQKIITTEGSHHRYFLKLNKFSVLLTHRGQWNLIWRLSVFYFDPHLCVEIGGRAGRYPGSSHMSSCPCLRQPINYGVLTQPLSLFSSFCEHRKPNRRHVRKGSQPPRVFVPVIIS